MDIELSTNPGVAVTSFTQDDLANNRVIYVNGDQEGIADSFTFEITDGFYTLPVDTFDITIIPQNDKPQITTNVPPSIIVGGDVTFDSAFLQGTDPDDADNEITFTVSNITNGTLTINGVAAINGSTFTQADVDAGLIEFTHDGTMTTTGTFDVSLADGGEDGATPDTATVVVNIEFVPVIDTNVGTTVLEGTVFALSDNNVITTAMLSVSDFDTPDNDIIFNITNASDHGRIELSTNPGVSVTSFTQDDLANNRVIYAHDGSETTFDSFDFEVTDGFYTLPVETFDINITPQNDPPELILVENTDFIENTLAGTRISDWAVVDPDNPNVTLSFVGSPSIFAINGNGLYVTQAVDYEADPHVYTITMRAFDGQYTIDQTFDINLGDMKEDVTILPPGPGETDTITVGERELSNFTPINNALEQEEYGITASQENEILRAASGSLDGVYYGGDVSQIIKDNVIDDVSKISSDLTDINRNAEGLNEILQKS